MDFMEWDTVTDQTWPRHLPQILKELSDCAFVALDLEFTGIPSHQNTAARRQTLQERYAESRVAAQKYQILQVGLTIVKEDAVAGKYTLKPYNVPLSPLIDPVLGIDRTFSFSSAAIQFLLKAGFNLDAPFQEGVRYLSTKEEQQAIQEASKYNSRSRTATIAQLELPKEESESIAFLAAVRKDIDRWLEIGQEVEDYLNVPSRNAISFDGRPAVISLNRFQKRLVHQLVETEYPSLTSIGRTDFVRIVKFDEQREESIRLQKMCRLEQRLLEHRGFRWIIEVLTGGDLSQLQSPRFLNAGDIPAKRGAIEDLAMKGRPPIVGHNLFLDLIYLWQCFYGDLPDRVEEFIQSLHEKFPMLIDTKYIFTHECGDMNPVASLEVIDEAYKNITKPEIVIDPKHTRYQDSEHLHEAGYDSLLTAKNFIRQAVQLPGASPKQMIPKTGPLPDSLSQAVSMDAAISSTTATKRSSKNSTTTQSSKFAHKNLYALLTEDGDGDGTSSDLASEFDALAVADTDNKLIPCFESPVWKIYGNKLRVFGTYERVCELNGEVPTSTAV